MRGKCRWNDSVERNPGSEGAASHALRVAPAAEVGGVAHRDLAGPARAGIPLPIAIATRLARAARAARHGARGGGLGRTRTEVTARTGRRRPGRRLARHRAEPQPTRASLADRRKTRARAARAVPRRRRARAGRPGVVLHATSADLAHVFADPTSRSGRVGAAVRRKAVAAGVAAGGFRAGTELGLRGRRAGRAAFGLVVLAENDRRDGSLAGSPRRATGVERRLTGLGEARPARLALLGRGEPAGPAGGLARARDEEHARREQAGRTDRRAERKHALYTYADHSPCSHEGRKKPRAHGARLRTRGRDRKVPGRSEHGWSGFPWGLPVSPALLPRATTRWSVRHVPRCVPRCPG